MSLEWTGERFVPWVEGAQIHYEHIHRYTFVSQFAKGKKVLDLACGEGYGSKLLSNVAENVVGLDIDPLALEHAHIKYNIKNLDFIRGSILEIPIKKKKFDVIVCFEGIEHIEEHEKFLSEVKQLMTEDGVFIVSSPNKKTYSDETGFKNPFHKKEMYLNEFKDLLGKYFKKTILLGQKVYGISNIWELNASENSKYKEFLLEKSGKEFHFSRIEMKDPFYFIAIASNKNLDHQSCYESNLLDVSNTLIEDLEKQVNEKINQLNIKEKELTKLESSLQIKDSQISELSFTLQSMRQSMVWRLLMKYQMIIDTLLPESTLRRKFYDRIFIGIRSLANMGKNNEKSKNN